MTQPVSLHADAEKGERSWRAFQIVYDQASELA